MSKKARGSKQNPTPKNRSEEFKRHSNWHHVYPTSRFKLKKNPVLHTAWHDVFQNSTPEEAIEMVERWMMSPEEFKEEIWNIEKKREAWETLFGKADFVQVLAIIQRDWTFPGIKMIKI